MAQLTLTERNSLAENSVFRGRVFQGLFAKANFQRGITPLNLKMQKQKAYADDFVLGGANSIDIYAMIRFWLANYNVEQTDTTPIGQPPVQTPIGWGVDIQPFDAGILSTSALDTVYDSLAGVNAGDELLPIV